MSYLGKEKSNFMPIFMALSIVAVVGFGLMYFSFGKTISDGSEPDTAMKSAAPPAAVQTITRETHTHV